MSAFRIPIQPLSLAHFRLLPSQKLERVMMGHGGVMMGHDGGMMGPRNRGRRDWVSSLAFSLSRGRVHSSRT